MINEKQLVKNLVSSADYYEICLNLSGDREELEGKATAFIREHGHRKALSKSYTILQEQLSKTPYNTNRTERPK